MQLLPTLAVKVVSPYLRSKQKQVIATSIDQWLTGISAVPYIVVESVTRGGTLEQGPPKKGAPARSPGKPRTVIVCQFR